MKEKAAFHVNGYLGLLGAIIIGLISLWLMFVGFTRNFLKSTEVKSRPKYI